MDDIIVDSMIITNNVSRNDRGHHGDSEVNAGVCLVKFDNQLYIVNIGQEIVRTEEDYFELSEGSRYFSFDDLTSAMGVKGSTESFYRDPKYANIIYVSDGLRRINPDGTITMVQDNKLMDSLKGLYDFTYRISNNENVNVHKSNIIYAGIDSKLSYRDNKLVLNMNGNEYVVDEMPVNETIEEAHHDKDDEWLRGKSTEDLQEILYDLEVQNEWTEKEIDRVQEEQRKQKEWEKEAEAMKREYDERQKEEDEKQISEETMRIEKEREEEERRKAEEEEAKRREIITAIRRAQRENSELNDTLRGLEDIGGRNEQ